MTVKEAIQQIYKYIFVPKVQQAKSTKYVKEAVILLFLASAMIGSFYLYRSWKMNGERAAQKLLQNVCKNINEHLKDLMRRGLRL